MGNNNQHPNTSVGMNLGNFKSSLYGAGGLGTLYFSLTDPAFETYFGGGTKTRNGIPDGKYQLVVRTGNYKPHSMTIKGKPAGDSPFVVTQGADGYYTLTLSATSEPWVLVDTPKWDACRAVKWDATCEPDEAFLRYLTGIIILIPPTYQEPEEVRTPGLPAASPSLSLSQGLWIASNTVVRDAKPELNLATKSLWLPAYGPHYVPTDFPSAGLTAEGNRYLNPAYFTAFIPNGLLAFVNNFQMAEIAEKAPGRISATIEDSSAKAIPQAHETTMTASGALIKVAITHYSAPNPKIYFGGTTSSTGGTTTMTTTPVPVAVAVAPSITSKKTVTARAIASYKKFVIPAGAQISVSVAAASKKYCKAVGATIKYVSAGTCKITVTAKPKKGSAKSTTVTLKVKK
jgi:hypothetical protein